MTALTVITGSSLIFVKTLWSMSKLYIFWTLVHYLSTHIYVHYCTPNNIIGFIKSPFMVITPECYTLDWIQQKSRDIIKNMWSLLAMWCSGVLMSKIDPRS